MLILNKAIAVVMMGFLSSVIFGLILIPLLKRMHVGQRISAYVGENHRKKEGTPTMGGLIFIVPTAIITLVLTALGYLEMTDDLKIVLVVFIGYALLGFLDDYLSIKHKENDGLTTAQKFLGQLIMAIIVFYLYMKGNNETSLVVSTLHINIEMGWFYGVFLLFLLIGSSNAVNLTDGLDGLAGGLSAIAFIAFSLISMMVGFQEIGLFTFLLVGCLLGFLVYNTHPAKVFMGDTGSLSLGAVMAVIAILVHREITLLVVAFVFVIETLSVILQVFWIKVFHKKLFLMTPLHHHFEKLGWQETDIVKLFWVVGLVLAMGGIYFGIWM